MFNATLQSAILDAKDKIDFTSLQFPIYRKNTFEKEWYRFDSATKMLSVRNNFIIGIGVALDISDEIFTDIYSFKEDCTKEEFDTQAKAAIDAVLTS